MDARDAHRLVADAERRTYRAGFEDGVDKLFGGAMFLLLGLAFAVPAKFRLVVWVGIGLAVIGLGPGRGAVKRRVEDRHAGVARPLSSALTIMTRRQVIALLVGCSVAWAMVFLLKERGALPPRSALPTHLLFVGIFLWRARKTGFGRYYALAIVPVVAALVSWRFGFEGRSEAAVLFGVLGPALLVSGAVVLRGFVRGRLAAAPQ